MNNEAKTNGKAGFFDKLNTYFHSKKWKAVWDKITTGILIFLLATPVLVLAYILIWFLSK